MSFWSFIGLADKQDISQLENELKNIKNELKTTVMECSNNETKKLNDIHKQIAGLKVDDRLDQISESIELTVQSSQQLVNELDALAKNVESIKKRGATKAETKKLNERTEEYANLISELNNEMVIIQKMLRALWVNDIADAIDSTCSK